MIFFVGGWWTFFFGGWLVAWKKNDDCCRSMNWGKEWLLIYCVLATFRQLELNLKIFENLSINFLGKKSKSWGSSKVWRQNASIFKCHLNESPNFDPCLDIQTVRNKKLLLIFLKIILFSNFCLSCYKLSNYAQKFKSKKQFYWRNSDVLIPSDWNTNEEATDKYSRTV